MGISIRHHLITGFTYNDIKFADNNAHLLCLNLFAHYKSNSITFYDLLQVTEIPLTLKDDINTKNIKVFNEYRYFVSIKTHIFTQFKNFKNLISIEFPDLLLVLSSSLLCYIYNNKIRHIKLPKLCHTISAVFALGACDDNICIILPSTLAMLYSDTFSPLYKNYKVNFIFTSINPPHIQNTNIYKLPVLIPAYTPDEYINNYKNNKEIVGVLCTEVLPYSQIPENIKKHVLHDIDI